MTFTDAYNTAVSEKKKQELLQEQIRKEAARLLQKTRMPKDDNEPYPGFNPKEPNPLWKYTGILYRISGSGKRKWLESVEEFDFEDIAFRFGHGNFELCCPDNTSSYRFRFPIDKALWLRVKSERGDDNDDSFVEPPDEPTAPPQPQVQPQNNINDVLLQIYQAKSSDLSDLLKTVLGKDTGASGTALQQSYKDGFDSGKSAMKTAIDAKDEQIKNLIADRDEWKNKAETLQIELGKMPDPNRTETEDDDAPPPPTGSEILFSKIGEGLGNAIGKVAENFMGGTTSPAPQQKQIQHNPENQQVDVVEIIKNTIIQSFAKQLPAVTPAMALWKWIKESKIDVSSYTSFPTNMILKIIVDKYMPNAEDALKSYAAGVIEELNKLAKA
jgi:hypothetical protein